MRYVFKQGFHANIYKKTGSDSEWAGGWEGGCVGAGILHGGSEHPIPKLYKGLVTNYGEGCVCVWGGGGGLQNGRVGQVKIYPYKKGGGKSFSHAEGGAQKVLR